MSVARFVADQRAKYRVPHTVTCALLGVSMAWFYKWIARAGDPDGLHTDRDRRRAELDGAVKAAFEKARGLHGSPRLVADLRDLGGVGEYCGRVDAPSGAGGAQDPAAAVSDGAGPGRTEVS